MNDKFNTIAGWVLGGGIVLLGATLVAGEIFSDEAPETKGYPIAGVVEEGEKGEAEQPIAALLATADAGRGANQFKKCTACHTINQGGPSGVGPNLWAALGQPLGHVPGFAYSDALKSKGGTWTWETMNEWIRNPRTFAPGTKMAFPGIGAAQDRADLLLYLNSQGSNLPLPAAPAAAPAAEGAQGNASGNAAAPTAGTASGQPTPTEAAAPKGGGEARPESTNPSGH